MNRLETSGSYSRHSFGLDYDLTDNVEIKDVGNVLHQMKGIVFQKSKIKNQK